MGHVDKSFSALRGIEREQRIQFQHRELVAHKCEMRNLRHANSLCGTSLGIKQDHQSYFITGNSRLHSIFEDVKN